MSLVRHTTRISSCKQIATCRVSNPLRPQWNGRIEELREQHDQFRQTIRRITTRLKRITPEERPTFENLCHELLDLIKRVAKHNHRENKLLEDAFLVDDGGEG